MKSFEERFWEINADTHGDLEAVFTTLVREGYDAAEAFDAVFVDEGWGEGSWWLLDVLIAQAGGRDEAQAILRRTRHCSSVELDTVQTLRELHDAIVEGARLDAILERAAREEVQLPEWMQRRALEKCELTSVALDRALDRDMRLAVLSKRSSAEEIFLAVRDLLDDEALASLLIDVWGVGLADARPGDSPAVRCLRVVAHLRFDRNRPVGSLIDWIAARWPDMPKAHLLGTLRNYELPATTALLSLAAGPGTTLEHVAVLAEAGYSDPEIVTAFRANAFPAADALESLSRFGWDPGRMVAAMTSQGYLAPEVRNLLDAIGVPRDQLRAALERHVPADVIALVLSA